MDWFRARAFENALTVPVLNFRRAITFLRHINRDCSQLLAAATLPFRGNGREYRTRTLRKYVSVKRCV